MDKYCTFDANAKDKLGWKCDSSNCIPLEWVCDNFEQCDLGNKADDEVKGCKGLFINYVRVFWSFPDHPPTPLCTEK